MNNIAQIHTQKSSLKDRVLRYDLSASIVVFLVALPLCAGVAVASGVPAELGLVTGIVGGIVVGLLPGSSLQVSGPAAGLTVLVYEAVRTFGIKALGVFILAAGILQLLMGLLKLGRWFRAISSSVIQGMLTGIGLLLIIGQLYTMVDVAPPGSGLANIAGLPSLIVETVTSTTALIALALGAGTIVILLFWKHLPDKVRRVPAPLAAVALATIATAIFGLPVATVEVRGLFEVINIPGFADLGQLTSLAALGTVVALALVASAESLFSATAVDRLHDGPRTDYDKELVAQGVGNTVCGVLGALPITAVIVRSSVNIEAGARTKASRVLHGVWLLLFAAFLPAVLGWIPMAALAAILIHAGGKLIPVAQMRPLWREHRGEALVLIATAVAIVATNMFHGVLIGLLIAVVKVAWETSHVHVQVMEAVGESPIRVRISGNATFLRLPRVLDTLESLPAGRSVKLDLAGLRYLDLACHTALTHWADRHRQHGGGKVEYAAWYREI